MQNPTVTLRPLFTTFANRYALRAGGYTRITRAGHRVGDHAPLAVLELVDGPHDLKFEMTARTAGRELAIRAREGAGLDGFWDFRKRVEGGTEAEVLARLEESEELEEMTRKNVRKALAFRQAETLLIKEPTEGEEADDTPPETAIAPSTAFLNRVHHHYLRSLATLSLSTTLKPDSERSITQLTQRLNPSDTRGAPSPVLTVPRMGRVLKAGERTDGWELEEGAERSAKVGGPIGRAKGSRSREGRRQVWTGTKRSDEALAEP